MSRKFNCSSKCPIFSGLFIPSGIHKVIKDIPKISFGNWKPILNQRPIIHPTKGNIISILKFIQDFNILTKCE